VKNQHRVTGPVSEIGREAWRARVRFSFAVALALSLNFHGFILSLEFGELGFGLPGFALPRTQRRVQAPDLTVRLVKAPAPAPEPAPTAGLPPVAAASKPLKPKVPPRADKSFEVLAPAPAPVAPPEASRSLPRRKSSVEVPAAETRDREPEIQARPQLEILAQDEPREETFSVPPPAPPVPEPSRAPEIAARKQPEEPPPAAQEEAEARRKEEDARREAEELARQRALALQKEFEVKKQEEAAANRKAELERRKEEEAARREAEERALALQKELEAKKLEEARRLALEEARRKAEVAEATRKTEIERRKEEEAKRVALEAEALRRSEEAAEARRKAEAAEARRKAEEAAAQARAAAGADTRGAPSGSELAAKALGQLRAPAVPFDPPRPPPKPAPADDPRRRSIIGEERDIVLRMYVESWRTKIERNGPLNYRPSAGMRAPDYPVVTVSIRSDGSLEDVHIHRSSGLRELDEAVRRIVRLYAPYSAFPPSLARQFDVIEIRRVWQFDGMLRIVEETK
jgi:TolA protein